MLNFYGFFLFVFLLALRSCHIQSRYQWFEMPCHSFDITVINEYFIFLFLFLHVCLLSAPYRISTHLVALHQGQFKVIKTTPTLACLLSSESTPHYSRANKNTLLMLHLTLLILPLWGHKQKGWKVEAGLLVTELSIKHVYSHKQLNSRLSLDKMAAILQTTFSSTFSFFH